MRNQIVALIVSLGVASFAQAEDWPQWLGPQRNGNSSEKIAVWKEAPKSLWRQKIGEGNSSPVVANGLVFIHTKVDSKDIERIQAFDAKTGEQKWDKQYDKTPFKPKYGEGPRATPVIDGKHLFTFGNAGTLACWETETGNNVWKVDTLKEFNAPNSVFGISSSPLIVGDQVVVMVGNNAKKPQGSGFVAFNKSDGKVAWKSLNDLASYAAPILAEKQILALTAANIIALNPKDGSEVWKFPFKDALFESSTTPVRVGDLVFGSSITAGSVCLKVTEKEGKQSVETVWKDPQLTCYFSTPIPISKEHMLVVVGKIFPPQYATIHCIEIATGKKTWTKEKIGTYHASLLRLGDGKILMLNDSGSLKLLEPNTKEYKESASAKLFEARGDAWAHPAFSNGKLYVRDAKELICFQLGE
jgi:outer membrane protein assembly factor BamB